MADRLEVSVRSTLMASMLDNEPATIIQVDTAPADMVCPTAADIVGEIGERGAATWMVAVGNPSVAGLPSPPTIDPDGTTVGHWVCLGDGGDDSLIRPIVWVPITPTSDPVTVTAGPLVTLDGEVTAAAVAYQADDPGDWTGAPHDVAAALDELAARDTGGGGGGGDPWPDGGGPHTVGSSGLSTVMDRQRVWLIGTSPAMNAIQVAGSTPGPYMLGVIHADHRPGGPMQGFAVHYLGPSSTWHPMMLVIDSDGSALGTPGGLWAVAPDLDDQDTVQILAEGVSWLVLPE